ncbi:unnamed protein product [Polarella glacialis]|uniref:EF-hand domain-containing protein n=1 Tax=Polarella glacialis TaxID=89957 RepID=A0A813LP01_POLGL|nr:unnamed protein product [Polarella glacialis]
MAASIDAGDTEGAVLAQNIASSYAAELLEGCQAIADLFDGNAIQPKFHLMPFTYEGFGWDAESAASRLGNEEESPAADQKPSSLPVESAGNPLAGQGEELRVLEQPMQMTQEPGMLQNGVQQPWWQQLCQLHLRACQKQVLQHEQLQCQLKHRQPEQGKVQQRQQSPEVREQQHKQQLVHSPEQPQQGWRPEDKLQLLQPQRHELRDSWETPVTQKLLTATSQHESEITKAALPVVLRTRMLSSTTCRSATDRPKSAMGSLTMFAERAIPGDKRPPSAPAAARPPRQPLWAKELKEKVMLSPPMFPPTTGRTRRPPPRGNRPVSAPMSGKPQAGKAPWAPGKERARLGPIQVCMASETEVARARRRCQPGAPQLRRTSPGGADGALAKLVRTTLRSKEAVFATRRHRLWAPPMPVNAKDDTAEAEHADAKAVLQEFAGRVLKVSQAPSSEEASLGVPVWECHQMARQLTMPVDDVLVAKSVFDSFDEDKSGYLGREEFSKGVQKMLDVQLEDPDLAESQANSSQASFNKWATFISENAQDNGDGSAPIVGINFYSFVQWYYSSGWMENLLLSENERWLRKLAKDHGITANHVDNIKDCFDLYDQDHSGQVDISEFTLIIHKVFHVPLGQQLPWARTRFFWSQIDKDGSGKVDFGEFLDWWLVNFKDARVGTVS